MSDTIDIISAHQEHIEKMNRQVHFTADNKRIILTEGGDYEIDLARCKTENEILHWVQHLCGKTWVTTEMLSHFISLACQHHKIDIQYS